MTKVDILYEDNHLLVVDKPVNMLSQSDVTNDLDILTYLKQYIKEKYNKPGNVYLGLVHRLDRMVGGIMVFAKTSKAASRLSDQVRTRTLKKRYLAVVENRPKTQDTFKDYLYKDQNKNQVFVTKDQNRGKYAELNYSVLSQNDNMTLVNINLVTGRPHQIRVQFSSRGYALLGDAKYGKKQAYPIALYAYQLKLIHPITKEVMTFKSYPKHTKPWTHYHIKQLLEDVNE